MIQILIVDDHAVVRQGIRFLLEQQPDFVVVGEGSNGKQAIKLAADLLPDVMLLDLLMPEMDGVTAVREIKRITPATQIIVLTSYYEDDQIFGVIKSGALSYLLKDTTPHDLVAAVRAAALGESILHPMVAARVLREMKQQSESPMNELTPRELRGNYAYCPWPFQSRNRVRSLHWRADGQNARLQYSLQAASC